MTLQETRVAILENGVLQELLFERNRMLGLVGNIYHGKVVRIMPGMEAAFVDIGLERSAFLHVNDVLSTVAPDRPAKINQLLHEGQLLTVQVVKDPLGSKGARLTTKLTIPSRFLVITPGNPQVAISTRIEDAAERQRLLDIVTEIRGDSPHGYIIRTVAEKVNAQTLKRDASFLQRIWADICQQQSQTQPANLIHSDLPLALRTLRDFVSPENISRIQIDSAAMYQRLLNFSRKYVADVAIPIEYYNQERPIFDVYNIEDEITRALQRKVMLKSGGYLIIDQTEAMTTIDVNSGSFLGQRNLEETAYKTNLEATQTLARQLRLRNLGGIIIIDFIDMSDEEHRRQVMRALNNALEKDHVHTEICAVSGLGLVEMTRKRTRESLEHVLCESCSLCQGRGSIRTAETICYEIFREIIRITRLYNPRYVTILAVQSVIDILLDELSDQVNLLEQDCSTHIQLQVESSYKQENFDVVMS